MSPESFATYPPGRLEWHPAHEESARGDPDTFLLHVAFVHAHGIPRGEFTTFSNTCDAPDASHGRESRYGVLSK